MLNNCPNYLQLYHFLVRLHRRFATMLTIVAITLTIIKRSRWNFHWSWTLLVSTCIKMDFKIGQETSELFALFGSKDKKFNFSTKSALNLCHSFNLRDTKISFELKVVWNMWILYANRHLDQMTTPRVTSCQRFLIGKKSLSFSSLQQC